MRNKNNCKKKSSPWVPVQHTRQDCVSWGCRSTWLTVQACSLGKPLHITITTSLWVKAGSWGSPKWPSRIHRSAFPKAQQRLWPSLTSHFFGFTGPLKSHLIHLQQRQQQTWEKEKKYTKASISSRVYHRPHQLPPRFIAKGKLGAGKHWVESPRNLADSKFCSDSHRPSSLVASARPMLSTTRELHRSVCLLRYRWVSPLHHQDGALHAGHRK